MTIIVKTQISHPIFIVKTQIRILAAHGTCVLRRKIYDSLLEWKGRSHKCLLLKGQRQVGKTYILQTFGRENYGTVVYSDLSSDPDIRDAFSETSVDSIVNAIEFQRGIPDLDPSDALIILDEIQSCPRARSALKMFTMDGRYDIIASGSLLGITNPDKRRVLGPADAKGGGYSITDEKSFERALARDDLENESVSILPMGYEEHLTMYSLDFEEFLWARGVPQESIDEIGDCIHRRRPLGDAILKATDRHFRDYMIVGGLPEAVQAFIDGNGDYMAAGKVLSDAISTCLMDFKNHSHPIREEKVRDCFFSIPVMLSRTNKKFMFSKVRNGDRDGRTSEYYDDSLMWLKQAGYAMFCFNLRDLTHPIETSVNRHSFKVYLSDTGMLNSLLGTESVRATYSWETGYNMGAVVENAMAEGIRKCGLRLRYYGCSDNTGGRRMELDFILESGRDIIAVEVKSGRDRTAPSLRKVRSVFDQVNRRVILSRSNVYTDGEGVEHYPLFAACFADRLFDDWDGPAFMAYDGM